MSWVDKWVMLAPIMFWHGERLLAQNVLDDPSFDHFYNLEYDQALTGFRAEAEKSPESADVYDHIAQTILYREMFRAGMLQSDMLTTPSSFVKTKMEMSAEDQREFTDAINQAMGHAKARLDHDPNDPAALYALGVGYSLRGNYSLTVRKAYLDALRDITAGRKIHNRVTRIAPALVDAQLTPGLYDYIVGSLPWGWRMLGFLGGFQGNRARGIAALERVASQGSTSRIDASVFLVGIYRRELRSADAIGVLNGLIPRLPRNYLLRLELARMYGDLGDRRAALDVLDQVEQFHRAHSPGYEMVTPDLLQKVRDRILVKIDGNRASSGE
jgi:tetratricopeptide (TPR) repeat protein